MKKGNENDSEIHVACAYGNSCSSHFSVRYSGFGCGAIGARGPRHQWQSGISDGRDIASMPRAELAALIKDMTDQMMAAARDLQFELAARLRDEIHDLKKELRGMDAAGLK